MKESLYVEIPQGKLRGKEIVSTFTGDTYYGFSGIPYAKTPVGKLRFMPPQPADGWEGTRDATVEGNDCIQYSMLTYTIKGSEDCLYANIYTPEPPQQIKKLKPVMVMIHWGGCSWGSSSTMMFGDVDFIMNSDIIVVTFNYRLHVFGFLNLGIPECPGNMGLKDQVMLLKWVQNNIEHFGGDPNDVTLFGSSSGASNINLHMMSPMSEGLFHKAILQGGHGLSPIWGYQHSPFERAIELAVVLGFTGLRTPKRLLEFFRTKKAPDLIKGYGILRHLSKEKNDVRCETCMFLPSVEKIEEGAFMLKNPREMFEDMRPMPTMFSMNEKEGVLAFCADLLKIIPKKLGRSLKENLWQYRLSPDTVAMVAKKVRPFYFKKKDAPTTDEMINLYTDLWFCEWNNTIDFIASHPSSPPVYVYQFLFDGEYNFSKKYFVPILPGDLKGSIHADDTSYVTAYKMFLCENNTKDIEYKERESRIIKKMASFITTFVKTSDPNSEATSEVHWKPFHPDSPSHLVFDDSLSIVDSRINPERVILWNEIIDYIKKNEPCVGKIEKSAVQISSNYVKENTTLTPEIFLRNVMSSMKK